MACGVGWALCIFEKNTPFAGFHIDGQYAAPRGKIVRESNPISACQPSETLRVDGLLGRHFLQRSPGSRNGGHTDVWNGNNDEILRSPGTSEKCRYLADLHGNPAIGRSLLEFSLVKEGHPIAIRREEREPCSFRLRYRHSFKLVESPDVKVRHSAFCGDISDSLPVGRESQGLSHVRSQFLFWRQRYGKPGDARVVGAGSAGKPGKENGKCHGHNRNERECSCHPITSRSPRMICELLSADLCAGL